jgi:hypothetical protein
MLAQRAVHFAVKSTLHPAAKAPLICRKDAARLFQKRRTLSRPDDDERPGDVI